MDEGLESFHEVNIKLRSTGIRSIYVICVSHVMGLPGNISFFCLNRA